MAQNPSRIAYLALVASPGDEAFALDHPDLAEALSTYERTRDTRDLARVPLTPGATLTLFGVAALTSAQRTMLESLTSEPLRRACAVLVACHHYLTGATLSEDGTVTGGARVQADLDANGERARDSWLERLHDEYGADAVEEIGAYALARARLPFDRDKVRARRAFALPWPLRSAK